jgi:hypothetical protein
MLIQIVTPFHLEGIRNDTFAGAAQAEKLALPVNKNIFPSAFGRFLILMDVRFLE